MTTIHVRKTHAGATSTGRRWPTDGAVLELPVDEAAELLAIPDGGFTAVPADEPTAKTPERAPEAAQDAPAAAPAGDAPREAAEAPSAPSPRPRRRRTSTKE